MFGCCSSTWSVLGVTKTYQTLCAVFAFGSASSWVQGDSQPHYGSAQTRCPIAPHTRRLERHPSSWSSKSKAPSISWPLSTSHPSTWRPNFKNAHFYGRALPREEASDSGQVIWINARPFTCSTSWSAQATAQTIHLDSSFHKAFRCLPTWRVGWSWETTRTCWNVPACFDRPRDGRGACSSPATSHSSGFSSCCV